MNRLLYTLSRSVSVECPTLFSDCIGSWRSLILTLSLVYDTTILFINSEMNRQFDTGLQLAKIKFMLGLFKTGLRAANLWSWVILADVRDEFTLHIMSGSNTWRHFLNRHVDMVSNSQCLVDTIMIIKKTENVNFIYQTNLLFVHAQKVIDNNCNNNNNNNNTSTGLYLMRMYTQVSTKAYLPWFIWCLY